MRIGEAARKAGVRPSTLRFYEQRGLLPDPPRRGGRREYGPEVLHALAAIRFARQAGFTLEEIRELRAESQSGRWSAQRFRARAGTKFAEARAMVARGRAMERLLQSARSCTCTDLRECRLIAGAS